MESKNLSERMAEILNGLTDEQKEKAKACKTPEDLIAFLIELDAALPDELLDAVAGGRVDDVPLFERTYETWREAGCPCSPFTYFCGLD